MIGSLQIDPLNSRILQDGQKEVEEDSVRESTSRKETGMSSDAESGGLVRHDLIRP
jgi:hypothetical protein